MSRLVDPRKKALAIWVVVGVLAALSACTSPIPRPDQITVPAVGTLMPSGHEEGVHPNLSPEQAGALFVNQTGMSLQIVVSDTIASISLAQDFLFILPPGTYQFYIYEPDVPPRAYPQTLEAGKMRYIYITPQLTR
jgi:hypothetical protein